MTTLTLSSAARPARPAAALADRLRRRLQDVRERRALAAAYALGDARLSAELDEICARR